MLWIIPEPFSGHDSRFIVTHQSSVHALSQNSGDILASHHKMAVYFLHWSAVIPAKADDFIHRNHINTFVQSGARLFWGDDMTPA